MSSYPYKFFCWMRFGIQGSNCTHICHWCWYNSDCIHEYPEHTHLCLQRKLHIQKQVIVLYTDCVSSYPHMFCCWRRFGTQGSNCTRSFHWCWYNSDCIHEYPEHIHLYLCGAYKIYCLLLAYFFTHTRSIVGRDLVSKVATAHIASIGVGTILIASMNTQSTFIYVCVVYKLFSHKFSINCNTLQMCACLKV